MGEKREWWKFGSCERTNKAVEYVLYTHMQIQLYMHIKHNYNNTTKKTSEDFFKRNIPLTLFERFVCERKLETEQNCNILTPTFMAISVVSLSFSMATQPEARGPSSLLDDGFLYRIFSPTHLISNSSGGPEGPFCQVVTFSTTSSLRLPVLTELYNSWIAHSIFGMACLIVIKRK